MPRIPVPAEAMCLSLTCQEAYFLTQSNGLRKLTAQFCHDWSLVCMNYTCTYTRASWNS